MAWEAVESKRSFGKARYGDKWTSVPAVALNKTGLTLNESFCDAFVNGHRQVAVFVDADNRRIGLRMPNGSDDNTEGLFSLQVNNSKSKTRLLNLPRLSKQFPDCQGRAFRAILNSGERIIEIDLSPDNQIR